MHLKHWGNCLSLIKTRIGIQSFTTWFKPIKPIEYKEKTLTLEVPNKFFYEWIEEHYINLLDEVIKSVLGKNGKIQYLVSKNGKVEKKLNEIEQKFIKVSSPKKFNNLNVK